jgi:hypothetical protein
MNHYLNSKIKKQCQEIKVDLSEEGEKKLKEALEDVK